MMVARQEGSGLTVAALLASIILAASGESVGEAGIALVTADHGKAEQMLDPKTGNVQTAHTTNDVDFIYVASDATDVKLRPRGILSDIALTMLQLLDITPPPEMTAESLLLP